MNAYDIGQKLALTAAGVEKTAVYPEEYDAAGNLGAVGGTLGGSLSGAALGEAIAKHIGQVTRQKHLGLRIPGTGVGESIFSTPKGPIAGEAMGALLGGAAGGYAGYHGGHLAALRHSPPGRLIHPDGTMDPKLHAFLTQQG